jgi:hypothetical protein
LDRGDWGGSSDGRLTYFHSTDPGSVGASKYQSPVQGAFVITGHGSSRRVDDRRESPNGKKVKYADEIAEDIRKAGWQNGQPIDLVVCHGGTDPGYGMLPLAQELADELRTSVRATNKYVFWWNDGTAGSYDRIQGEGGARGWLPVYESPGEWKIFKPRE